MKNIDNKHLVNLLATLFVSSIATVIYLSFNPMVGAITIIVQSVLFLIIPHRSIVAKIIVSFLTLYFLPFYRYFYHGHEISFYFHEIDQAYYLSLMDVTFLCNQVLFVGLAIASMAVVKTCEFSCFLKQKYHIVSVSLLLLMFISLVYGQSGQNIFVSNGYGIGPSQKSSLHEYFILFSILFLLITTPTDRLLIFLFWTLSILWMIKTLVYGGRIEIISWIIVYITHKRNFFQSGIKTMDFIYLGIAYICTKFFSLIRYKPLDFVFDPLGYVLRVITTSSTDLNGKQIGNEPDAIYAGARLIMLRNENVLSNFDLAASGLLSIVPQPFPSSFYPDFVTLSKFGQSFAATPGGGFIWGYAFAWFSLVGCVALPLVIVFFMLITEKYKNNIFGRAIGLIFLATMPRWVAYTPLPIFKWSFLAILFLLIVHLLFKSSKVTVSR